MKKIPLIKPYITQEIKDKVCEVLDSGYLTEGPVTKDLEDAFKDFIGCKYALSACNCTVGLEMALRVLGIGPGDEVIVPDYTYPATADVVSIVGAKTIIVDVSRETMLIDYDRIEDAITDNTKAIIPVSIFGNPIDYDRLNELKNKHGFYIIEDAACSIGAEYKDKTVGNHADISVFSLHPRKFITTGEGGIITTNNTEWCEWMLSYKHFGMSVNASRSTTNFDRIGTNYKMSNILAAVGLVQMKHVEELLKRRIELTQNYIGFLTNSKRVILPETTEHGKHSRQSFCIFVENRDGVMKKLRKIGIEVQIGTYALHMHKAFNDNPCCKIVGEMSGSKYAFEHCLTLPLYHELTYENQKYIIENLFKILD
jgi:perosamine synthetase